MKSITCLLILMCSLSGCTRGNQGATTSGAVPSIPAASSKPAPRLEFRGIYPGTDLESFKAAMKRIDASEDHYLPFSDKFSCTDRKFGLSFEKERDPNGVLHCSMLATQGMVIADFINRKLISLEWRISPSEFEEIVAALSEKYGKPLSWNESYQNSYGATFTGNVAVWNQGKIKLWANKYRLRSDTGAVSVEDTELIPKKPVPPI